jgi:lipopolysaccharide export system permease protein
MYDEDGQKTSLDKYQLPTTLSMDNFVEGIKPPHDLNFWALSDAIYNLKSAGLPIIKHQIYFYKLLFRPITMVSLILFAACFISVDNRSKSKMPRTVSGIFSGFMVYLLSQTFGNILAFSGINPMIAMTLPTLIVILLSCFAILHLRID